jgi:predicted PurR-regulated permease PerM
VNDAQFLSRAIETAVRLGLVFGLVAWCFAIVWPFVVPVAWAAIIAVAAYPGYVWLERRLGGASRTAAGVVVLLGLLLVIVPTAILGGTVVDGAHALAAGLKDETLAIPAPPEALREWPVVGEPLYAWWAKTLENLGSALETLRPQLVSAGRWVVAAGAGAGLTLLQLVLSIGIAGVLLVHAPGSRHALDAIARRLVGARGPELAELAAATTRSVAQGILGVALIQSFLAGLGFLAVGVPGAGLWALIGLLLCVVQIGLLPVTLPIVIYVFSTAQTGVAVLFTIWTVLVSLLDNVLKPLLLGRGMKVPTLVVFLGSLGGFLTSGIIGLFVGSVVLVLGFTLFRAWLEQDAEAGDTA